MVALPIACHLPPSRAGHHRQGSPVGLFVAACSPPGPSLEERNQKNILQALQAKERARTSPRVSKGSGGRRRATKPDVPGSQSHTGSISLPDEYAASSRSNTGQFGSSAGAHKVSDSELLAFERSGHITMQSLLTTSDIAAIRTAVSEQIEAEYLSALQHRIRVLLPKELQVTVRSRDAGLQHLTRHAKELGFLQFFNLHRSAQYSTLL